MLCSYLCRHFLHKYVVHLGRDVAHFPGQYIFLYLYADTYIFLSWTHPLSSRTVWSWLWCTGRPQFISVHVNLTQDALQGDLFRNT